MDLSAVPSFLLIFCIVSLEHFYYGMENTVEQASRNSFETCAVKRQRGMCQLERPETF